MKLTFPKTQRLCSRRLIGTLHREGRSFRVYPFRANWLRLPADSPVAVGVLLAVPKYNFRKAVDRNLIRRRMREAYRLHRHLLGDRLQARGTPVALSIAYTAKEILPFSEIQAKIILLLQRLSEENEKVTG